MARLDPPRLIADIGGTYARFALETAPCEFAYSASLRSADYPDFHAAISAYLNSLPASCGKILQAAIAIANPVDGDFVRMTNYPWQFSIEATRERLGLDTLVVVNDFTALAMTLPRLSSSQRRQVGGGQAREPSVVGLLGAGSGLGMSGLIPSAQGWVALGTEGGHTSFAPQDERELAILRYAWRQFEHVSFERLLSGPGLELMYRALAERAGQTVSPLGAPDITQRALVGSDALCLETLEVFCALLGTAASNLAVTLGALGGVYIGGGIVPRLGTYFDQSPFRQRFEQKGRFSDYLKAIPTYVITADNPTFLGVSAILDAQLQALGTTHGDGAPLLEHIRRALPTLSPAERRVAEQVLASPRTLLNDPIAEIARIAQVSQPTVIRFCRSLGCEGLSDFKLRLASGLTGTIPLTHAQVTQTDSMVELGSKVLGNTASAILQVRDQLNRDSIDRAIALLNTARRIELYASGYYGPVALDAQFKFLRFGIACSACTDSRLQPLTAAALGPQDVVVVISHSGKVSELLEVVELAQARGAQVLAITASQSPLARKADVLLVVDHEEDVSTHVPMISRILHLLVIDILAVGVALRRESPTPALGGLGRKLTPGVSTSTPLARLTSHSR